MLRSSGSGSGLCPKPWVEANRSRTTTPRSKCRETTESKSPSFRKQTRIPLPTDTFVQLTRIPARGPIRLGDGSRKAWKRHGPFPGRDTMTNHKRFFPTLPALSVFYPAAARIDFRRGPGGNPHVVPIAARCCLSERTDPTDSGSFSCEFRVWYEDDTRNPGRGVTSLAMTNSGARKRRYRNDCNQSAPYWRSVERERDH